MFYPFHGDTFIIDELMILFYWHFIGSLIVWLSQLYKDFARCIANLCVLCKIRWCVKQSWSLLSPTWDSGVSTSEPSICGIHREEFPNRRSFLPIDRNLSSPWLAVLFLISPHISTSSQCLRHPRLCSLLVCEVSTSWRGSRSFPADGG